MQLEVVIYELNRHTAPLSSNTIPISSSDGALKGIQDTIYNRVSGRIMQRLKYQTTTNSK